MATKKLTITLDAARLKEIRELVEAGQSPSVSAFVQHAVDIALNDVAGWQAMLEQALERTGGPLTAEEIVWADRALGGPAGLRRRRRTRAA